MAQEETLFALRLETDRVAAPAVEAVLDSDGEAYSVWRDEDRDYVKFEFFFPLREDASVCLARVIPRINALVGEEACAVSTVPIPREDWSESWKAFFHVEKVSERVVIKPSWEAYTPSAGEVVIELDPGMSFGTGNHATTRACLRFIDRLSGEHPGVTCLDLGCGSGILSIAAARLGMNRVTAIDNDADAVRIARENCVVNGVGEQVHCLVGDLATWRPDHTYDVVVANILAGVLCRFADTVTGCVAPGGKLVLAGILREQYPEVKACFAGVGFREVGNLTEEEWQSGLFEDAR